MSNYASIVFPGRVVTSLVDPNKGTVNNRFDCVGEHVKTAIKGNAQLGLVAGAAAGVTYAAHKSPTFANWVTKGLKSVQTLMGKSKFTSGIAQKVTTALSGLSKTGKIGVIAGALALPFLYFIDQKNTYKAGQIDQKYTDRASVQGQLDNFIRLDKMS